MVMKGTCTVSALDAMKNITVEVRVKRVKEAKIRIWIGIRLIKLAAWIMKVNGVVSVEEGS